MSMASCTSPQPSCRILPISSVIKRPRASLCSRMALHHVIPRVPVRQWVISFPWVVRYLLARNPALCSAVRRIFLRAVFGFYQGRAAAGGIQGGRTRAVNRIQRLGSSLNQSVHSYALLLDGVYTAESPLARPVFHPAAGLEDAEV